MPKNHAVFILSHGRPDNVITFRTLRNSGYTGKIYIIVDDEDKQVERYRENFGDQVIVFKKSDYDGRFDIMDNFGGRKVIVFARHACYDIARSLGLDYFCEFEDDYVSFWFKYEKDGVLLSRPMKSLDGCLESMIELLSSTGSSCVAFAQGGDYMGGDFASNQYKRKCMNTLILKVNEDPKDDVKFIGRMNDDANTYLSQGMVGKLFFQIADACVIQIQTQKSEGGNSEAYKKFGTYVKSFYSVMISPSSCKIGVLGETNFRIHHKIQWRYTVPKILRETFKK